MTLELIIGGLTALPFMLAYWGARYVARRGQAAAMRRLRPWQFATLQAWTGQGWLEPELAADLPQELSPGVVFYEWGGAHPEVARYWRFREPVTAETPVEALVRDAWSNLPAEVAGQSRERLAAAVREAGNWWGGVERGWNGRPLALLASAVARRQQSLPLLPMEDLTAAPLPAALQAEELARSADGSDLVLALAALRRMGSRFTHPLAPRADGAGSLVAGLSARVATDLGRRLGAGLGSALGPVGSMVGQYLGEMAGALGGKALADQTLPAAVSAALKEAEQALGSLGELAFSDDFSRAAQQPAVTILDLGRQVEAIREDRSRRLRERLWPSLGLVMVEETLRVALGALRGYRAAADHFVTVARKAPPAVAGGMVVQNPWLVRRMPGGVDRLNAARAALNRAAAAVRSAAGSSQGGRG